MTRQQAIAVCTVRPVAGNDPDIERMLRVQRDEPGAFADLIEHYWSRVLGRFYRQFGDRQEAEDLSQEVFLRLYRSRHRYCPRARFATWIFHIARNVARNELRTRRRRYLTPIGLLAGNDEDYPSLHALADGHDAPHQPLERAELAGAVREAVAALIERQRTAVELQFLDCSYSEIAEELDVTPKAAKSLLYRARNQLRETLGRVAEHLS